MSEQVKRKITLPKFQLNSQLGRLKETELSTGGTVQHIIGASQANNHCDSQYGRDVENHTESGLIANNSNLFVSVVDIDNIPLMPTTCSRAKRWIKSGKATGFWKRGFYCVRLNIKPSRRKKQKIAIGIDTGSKREAYTIKSKSHTYMNIQSHTIDWVQENIEIRRNLRMSRRGRNTPCRKNNTNRSNRKYFIPPSTKSRWQLKLRIVNLLRKIYPITHCIIEDVCAKTIPTKSKWNKTFNSLQSGKNWFYKEIEKIVKFSKKPGYFTKELRDINGLEKISNKLSTSFEAHCVDSWVLANYIVGGHKIPDNMKMNFIKPLRFHRRNLHVKVPVIGNIRKKYGGTISMGFKRGSLVTHFKYGLVYVGGSSKGRITVHSVIDGYRLCRTINPADVKFLTYNTFLNIG